MTGLGEAMGRRKKADSHPDSDMGEPGGMAVDVGNQETDNSEVGPFRFDDRCPYFAQLLHRSL